MPVKITSHIVYCPGSWCCAQKQLQAVTMYCLGRWCCAQKQLAKLRLWLAVATCQRQVGPFAASLRIILAQD